MKHPSFTKYYGSRRKRGLGFMKKSRRKAIEYSGDRSPRAQMPGTGLLGIFKQMGCP